MYDALRQRHLQDLQLRADAEILENEFRPEISALDLISLPNYDIYLKLMIDGKLSRTFSGETLIRSN